MEAKGIKAAALRIITAQPEGERAKRIIEACCAFIIAAAGKYGCAPFAAAACCAAWLSAPAPAWAMLAAVLGAAYAQSVMSAAACLITAGAAIALDALNAARGWETPPHIRIIVPLGAQLIPLAAVYFQNRSAFLLGALALTATAPLSAALGRAWDALWAYLRGKRLRPAEAGTLLLLALLVCICALLCGAWGSTLPLACAAAAALSLCRANRFAARQLNIVRFKLKAAAAAAHTLAQYAPRCPAYICGMGAALEKMSLPQGRRQPSLDAEAGAAAAAMAQSPANGDAMAIQRSGAELLLILSDGMGSGRAAHAESAKAVELYGELMALGFDEKQAVRSVNEILFSLDTAELYATLDAVRVNLISGEATILKQSAPPAFLIRGGRIAALHAEAPPLGILQETSVGLCRARLCAGDTLVLMTDGLSDALGAELYAAMYDIAQAKASPGEAARELIRRAGGISARDDMSAIVARFYSFHKNAQF